MPSYLEIIGAAAFSGCTALTTIDFSNYSIDKPIPKLGSYLVFSGCNNLSEIRVPEDRYDDWYSECGSSIMMQHLVKVTRT